MNNDRMSLTWKEMGKTLRRKLRKSRRGSGKLDQRVAACGQVKQNNTKGSDIVKLGRVIPGGSKLPSLAFYNDMRSSYERMR
jgi:hypothetical protein